MSRAAGRCSFRFLDAWLSHPDFHAYVKEAWLSYPTTGGMYGFYNKLLRLKHDIQRWNKNIFSNIFMRVERAEANVRRAEATWDQALTETNRSLYHQAKDEYIQASKYELHFWKQKAHV